MSKRAPAARTSAPDRVARLLAIIPWIAAQDGPTKQVSSVTPSRSGSPTCALSAWRR